MSITDDLRERIADLTRAGQVLIGIEDNKPEAIAARLKEGGADVDAAEGDGQSIEVEQGGGSSRHLATAVKAVEMTLLFLSRPGSA